MLWMVASSIPCKLSLRADRVQALAGGSHVSSGIDVACPTTQCVFAIASLHELQGDSWPSSSTGISFCCNQQYSVTAITTSTGAIAERYAYTAYGQPTILNATGAVISATTLSNRYTYTGREWDATLGLHHFRARWMSPSAGRFLGRDPIGYSGGYSQVSYTLNKPLLWIDPLGLDSYVPPVVNAHPNQYVDGYPHPVWIDFNGYNARRCIFRFDPFHGDLIGGGSIPTNGGVNVPPPPVVPWSPPNPLVVNPTIDIPRIVEEYGCCEVIIAGHQGGCKNVGGVSGPNGPILPNVLLENFLRLAFERNGCSKCTLVIPACGGCDKDAAKRDRVRKSIAYNTGCDVYATKMSIPYYDPDEQVPTDVRKDPCTLDKKLFNTPCGPRYFNPFDPKTYNDPRPKYQPFPFHHIPSTNPIAPNRGPVGF